jgi:hypothetical protein
MPAIRGKPNSASLYGGMTRGVIALIERCREKTVLIAAAIVRMKVPFFITMP